jgi:hypothetical protein
MSKARRLRKISVFASGGKFPVLTLSYINTVLSQSAFRIYKCYIINNYLIVPALAWEDIISNHSVPSEIDCAFNCGNEPTCAGFKYKFGTNSPSVNCQLSNTTGKNNMANYDDQGWVFFIDVRIYT